MRVAICGVSGFIGQHLKEYLITLGCEVISITRGDMKESQSALLHKKLEGADAVINIAGAPINRRWSDSYKQVMYNSRVGVTKQLVEAINSLASPPKVYIAASAVGYYAQHKCFDETTTEYGDSFLSLLCYKWEQASTQLNPSIRRVIMRMGVILSADGGAYEKIIRLARYGKVGVKIGRGNQRIPWIAIDDVARLYYHALINNLMVGVVNCVAPQIVTNSEMCKALSKRFNTLNFTIPKSLLTIVMGEVASVVTEDRCITPSRAKSLGYRYLYGSVDSFFESI